MMFTRMIDMFSCALFLPSISLPIQGFLDESFQRRDGSEEVRLYWLWWVVAEKSLYFKMISFKKVSLSFWIQKQTEKNAHELKLFQSDDNEVLTTAQVIPMSAERMALTLIPPYQEIYILEPFWMSFLVRYSSDCVCNSKKTEE